MYEESDKTSRDGLPKIHAPGTCVGGRTELFLCKKYQTSAKRVKHIRRVEAFVIKRRHREYSCLRQSKGSSIERNLKIKCLESKTSVLSEALWMIL